MEEILSQTHKKVQVVIIAKDDRSRKLLLLKTNEQRGSFWQNVTGSVEEGEDFLDAASRELHEETSFLLNTGELIDLNLAYHFKDRWEREIEERAYLALITDNALSVALDSNEHSEFKWCTVGEISKDYYKFESNYECFLEAIKHV